MGKFLAVTACGLFIVGSVYVYRNYSLPLHGVLGFGSGQQIYSQSPVPKPQSSPAKPRGMKTRAESPTMQLPLRETVTANAVAPVEARVKPVSSEVPVNMSVSDLVGNFGKPDFMASWSDQGKLNRKLIYTDGAKSLEVNVQNDLVVSTQ